MDLTPFRKTGTNNPQYSHSVNLWNTLLAALESGVNATATSIAAFAGSAGSALVGFIQSGTGAVARTAQDKGREAVSVKDFGAVGNGSTDDTSAIQLAINAVASGGTVLFPAGTYKVTAALNVSANNIRLTGAGRKATTLKQFTASAKTLNVTAEYFTATGLAIEYNANGTAGGIAIYNNNFYGHYSDIYIKKAYVGWNFDTGANSHFLTDVVAEDCTANGFLLNDCANVSVVHFYVLNQNTTTYCTAGCLRMSEQVEGVHFTDGQFYKGVSSFASATSSYTVSNRPAYNKFTNVYFDSSANGALIDKCVEFDFESCWFSNRPGNGAIVSNSDGVRFSGGGAINCDMHGVLVQATAKRVVFKGFAARGNSVAAANTYSGIIVAANTTDFIVQGGVFTNAELSFGTQKWGVEVQSGTSDRYVISDNLVSGNGTGGVSDGGSGANKRVANNY